MGEPLHTRAKIGAEKPVQGRLKMGFFTARERAELGTSVEIGVEGKGRESVRHDFAPRQRPREDGAAALEQTVAEPHPQEGEEAEATTRAKEIWIRHRRDDIR